MCEFLFEKFLENGKTGGLGDATVIAKLCNSKVSTLAPLGSPAVLDRPESTQIKQLFFGVIFLTDFFRKVKN